VRTEGRPGSREATHGDEAARRDARGESAVEIGETSTVVEAVAVTSILQVVETLGRTGVSTGQIQSR